MPDYDDNTYLDTEATEERLDQAVKELVFAESNRTSSEPTISSSEVKEFLWDSLQKKFVPYPYRVEDKLDE